MNKIETIKLRLTILIIILSIEIDAVICTYTNYVCSITAEYKIRATTACVWSATYLCLTIEKYQEKKKNMHIKMSI